MDARTSELTTPPTADKRPPDSARLSSGERAPSTKRSAIQERRKTSQRRNQRRRKGREVVKSGMAASLAVTMMTGLKILRPMRIHPIAAWVFVGLTLVHMLVYDPPSKKE
ncbi:MAG: hypothetical protein HQL72_03875 [Magnetococcales bacterium]|nr:hypothetical protein [Magnetococcales bacterium]